MLLRTGGIMKKLANLFFIFLKIGTFTVGGGYAMIPLIEKEIVDKKGWIGKEDFVDMLALAQSSPGPIAVNAAIFVGYKVAGFPGSIIAVFGSIVTVFLIMVIIAMYFIGAQDNAVVERIFKGIRPAVVALIAAPVIRMGKNANINKKTIIIPIAAVILIVYFKISAIYVILFSAIGGLVLGSFRRKSV